MGIWDINGFWNITKAMGKTTRIPGTGDGSQAAKTLNAITGTPELTA